ncbi:hypothetical protein SNE40_011898 [Patella caerulea]|uniref:Uncharacterized protein n=1 Tax=Patella caerulea TaxID=87958 RepID=A0AAN8JNP8_PATCE
MMQCLKENVQSTTNPITQLYQEEINGKRNGEWTDDNRTTIANMPNFYSKKSTLYRARNTKFPKLPKHRRDIVVPELFQQTDSGEQFLLGYHYCP